MRTRCGGKAAPGHALTLQKAGPAGAAVRQTHGAAVAPHGREAPQPPTAPPAGGARAAASAQVRGGGRALLAPRNGRGTRLCTAAPNSRCRPFPIPLTCSPPRPLPSAAPQLGLPLPLDRPRPAPPRALRPGLGAGPRGATCGSAAGRTTRTGTLRERVRPALPAGTAGPLPAALAAGRLGSRSSPSARCPLGAVVPPGPLFLKRDMRDILEKMKTA